MILAAMTSNAPHCPRCGHRGHRVSETTLERLVLPSHRSAPCGLTWFCGAPRCDVVYFDVDGDCILTTALRVVVFEKSTDPARPVCYCFGHTVAEVIAATRPDGSNAIVEAITDACRRGVDRCDETNPRGRCCLGNVRALLGREPVCCGGAS